MVPPTTWEGIDVDIDPKAVREAKEGEQDEWTEFLPEFEDAVERGLCDEVLKQMARALFDRRDVLMDRAPGTSFVRRDQAPPRPNGNGRSKYKPSDNDPMYSPDGMPIAAVPVDAEGVFVGKVALATDMQLAGAKNQKEIATVNGKRYMKSDIKNLVVRVPEGVKPDYIKGLRVRITGVGDSRCKCEWVDLPPTGTKLRTMADNNEPLFLVIDTLKEILA
jgi:hypothetical protein